MAKARWCTAFSVGFALAPQVARAQESVPDMLRRVAPRVVQIKVDKEADGQRLRLPCYSR